MDHLDAVRPLAETSVGRDSPAANKALAQSGKEVQKPQSEDFPSRFVFKHGDKGPPGGPRVERPCDRAFDESTGAGLTSGGGQRSGPVFVA